MSKDTKLGEGDFRNILPRFTPEALEKKLTVKGKENCS
jgi:hypothetical protein